MRRVRVRGRAGSSSGFFLAAAVLAAGAALLTAGPAAASGTVTCPPQNGTDVQNAINGGGTVTINGTCHGNFDVTVDVTIQGGSPGATLNGDDNAPVLTIHNGVTVTIRNLVITNGFGDCFGGGLDIYDGSTVNVLNSSITGNTSCDEGGGIGIEGFSTVNLTASKVTNNSADDYGGGIAAFDFARVTSTNSAVSGNTAGLSGGGIYAQDSYVAMTGTTVDHNTASNDNGDDSHGGGVDLDGGAVMYANASTFSSNQARSFDGGEPSGDGGGIRIFASNAQLVASRVLGNLANDDGGGIGFLDQCGTFCLEDAPINHVKTKAFPSPFDVPSGLTLDGTTVDHNQAVTGTGGGLNLEAEENDAPTTLTNSTVSNNVTLDTSTFGESGGAGISQSATDGYTASLTTANTSIYGNRSGSVGGGIANFGFSGVATVSTGQTTNFQSPNALQVGNQAKYGGGVYNAGDQASVSLNAGTKMARNKATVNGGGVYDDCSGSLFVAPGVVFIANYPNNVFLSPFCLAV